MTPAIAIVCEPGAVALPAYSGFVFMQIESLSFEQQCRFLSDSLQQTTIAKQNFPPSPVIDR
jgi:hypothetical protein